MHLGFTSLSSAQSLVVTASQTNAMTNDIITFYATFYNQNSDCVDDGSVNWNFGTNAIIIDGAGSGMVQVRYTSAGTRRVSANVNVNCNGGRPSRLGSTVTVNITLPPISISGTITNTNTGAGISNVAISAGSNYATSDINGNYTLEVPNGWSGTVTPSSYGCGTFSPNSIYLNAVSSNLTNINFTTQLNNYVLSGVLTNGCGTPIPNVEITGLPSSVFTDGQGRYTVNLPCGWGGAITPTHPTYTFPTLVIDFLSANRVADFSATINQPPTPQINVTDCFPPCIAAFGCVVATNLVIGEQYRVTYSYNNNISSFTLDANNNTMRIGGCPTRGARVCIAWICTPENSACHTY